MAGGSGRANNNVDDVFDKNCVVLQVSGNCHNDADAKDVRKACRTY